MKNTILLINGRDFPINIKSRLNNIQQFHFLEIMSLHEFKEINENKLLVALIVVNDINSFLFAKNLRDKVPNTEIIFFSKNASFAYKSFEFRPINFFVFPIDFGELLNEVYSIYYKNNVKGGSDHYFHLKVQEGLYILNVEEIIFIEKREKKVIVYLKNKKELIFYGTLKNLEEKLINYNFVPTHQSFLVPLKEILEIKQDSLFSSYIIKLRSCRREIQLSKSKYSKVLSLLQSNTLSLTT
ncbi:MAG: LytTR family DNA-binding domain-containing protein [Virgibacillus proomii]